MPEASSVATRLAQGVIARDFPIMLILTVMIIAFAFTPPKRNLITRWEALIFLGIYIGYQGVVLPVLSR